MVPLKRAQTAIEPLTVHCIGYLLSVLFAFVISILLHPLCKTCQWPALDLTTLAQLPIAVRANTWRLLLPRQPGIDGQGRTEQVLGEHSTRPHTPSHHSGGTSVFVSCSHTTDRQSAAR